MCSMIFCAPCGATRCATWRPRLSYSHESDDDDIEERYLHGRKSVEQECSWLSMQLWKFSTERMPVKARHSHSGKHHGYDANCAGFSKDVKQPQSSETHRRREHSHRCRFARHLHTLLPTLGQSLGSRGHRLLDSLSGRATRACPPSKKLTGWAPEPVANTQRLHACYLVTTCHVKWTWMSPSNTPATQRAAASQATNPDQARHPVQ